MFSDRIDRNSQESRPVLVGFDMYKIERGRLNPAPLLLSFSYFRSLDSTLFFSHHLIADVGSIRRIEPGHNEVHERRNKSHRHDNEES